MEKLEKSKTRKELLDNTVAYYSEDVTRRAFNEDIGFCEYITPDGRMCAIGREVTHPEKLPNSSVHDSEAFKSLPKRLRKMGQDFLIEIQGLHDDEDHEYWGRDGLTKKGRKIVKQIESDYIL
jgi:hypothetical protein